MSKAPASATAPVPPVKLQPPGAGLPALELFIARRLFSWRVRRGTRERFLQTFQEEQTAIQDLVASCPEELRGKPVLVPRLRGLEDSSRFWSVWMTLDHLRITNEVFAHVIRQLSEGWVPPRTASTAAVKPSPQAGLETEAAFAASCAAVPDTAGQVEELRTEVRYAHPWFGPLDGFGWLALSAMHMGIHRKQLHTIRSRLC